MQTKIKPIQGYQMCPFCGGSIEYAGISSGHIFPAIHTGQMYVCKECGYQGSFIIEVDDPDEVNNLKEALNSHNEGIKTRSISFPVKWVWFWRLMLILLIAVLLIPAILLLISYIQAY